VPNDLGRSRFSTELMNPRVLERLLAYTKAEVGGQGPEAQQAFMETIFNRAVARGKSLAEVLSGSYFPSVTHERASRGVDARTRAAYDPVVQSVLGGSNITNFATGNASGTVGFAGGPQTYAAAGERFGIEGPDRGWWNRIGVEGPTGVGSVPYTGGAQSLANLQSLATPQAQGQVSGPLRNLFGGPFTDPLGQQILGRT
jgi:hypothetical protein